MDLCRKYVSFLKPWSSRTQKKFPMKRDPHKLPLDEMLLTTLWAEIIARGMAHFPVQSHRQDVGMTPRATQTVKEIRI